MESTGRIRRPVHRRASRIVFGGVERALAEELPHYVQVDRAHLVMLAERGLLPRETGRRVLGAIGRLRAEGFAPLGGRPAPRGLYLLYEDWLIETLGEEAGGAVHLARSRNDMSATVLRLRLRPAYRGLVHESLRLLAVLARLAGRHAEMVMPAYTHHQAALPVTYGHYLAGVGLALLRDVHGLEDAARDLDRCPLGAGAAGGTSVAIDPARTARLLGFERPAAHSADAVASRDLPLRLLAAAAVLGVTLSRLATDLQLWSTAELGLVRFPDALVGSSSMMPQKRNAFLLEHVQGRAGAPLGAFTAAATAMHAAPFANSVAVGTEGVRPLWDALQSVTEAVVLARLSVAGAQPCPERMRSRAAEGATTATEAANRLVTDAGLPFRRAHHAVGRAVTEAAERGEPFAAAAGRLLAEHGVAPARRGLDPAEVSAASGYGGGPGPRALAAALAELKAGRADAAERLRDRARRWSEGERELDRAAASLLAGGPVRQAARVPVLAAQP